MRVKKLCLFLVCIGLLSACTSPDKAREVLTSNGYKNIEITGYKPFACSDSDSFQTGFIATSPSGQKVKGTVCNGILKGATIRFD
jgi:major membrane immunogen (membrane-anchored lipoprotein)